MNKPLLPHFRAFSLSRVALPALAIMAGLLGADTAHADTYRFAIPATTIQNALTANLVSPNVPDQYAFYEIYIRPVMPGDPGATPSLTSYTPQSSVPPIVSGPDAWTSTTDTAPFDGPAITSFKFIFSPAATILALVTSNPNVNGKIIDDMTAEQIPGTDVFQIFFTSTAPLLSNTVNFKVFGFGYKFDDATAEYVLSKGVLRDGYFTYTGDQVPEPASFLTLGGGFVLLAIFLKRRRAAAGL